MVASAKPLSLKARAIALLAMRDHSKSEFRRKLIRIARQMQQRAQASDAQQQSPPDLSIEAGASDSAESLDSVVDDLLRWLEASGYLNELRFAESRVHTRAARYGNLRIQQELAQHGLELDAQAQAELRSTEVARARAVWLKKFGGQTPRAAGERAKQMRFLAARGFSSSAIHAVLRHDADE